jgi:hydrogenase nickel incorporation protein HypA/HybF
MHELSIAQGILDIVREHVPEGQSAGVRTIEVRVGRMSGVVPESLEFCFEALVLDSPFQLGNNL